MQEEPLELEHPDDKKVSHDSIEILALMVLIVCAFRTMCGREASR
jgi:hypothetical protein